MGWIAAPVKGAAVPDVDAQRTQDSGDHQDAANDVSGQAFHFPAQESQVTQSSTQTGQDEQGNGAPALPLLQDLLRRCWRLELAQRGPQFTSMRPPQQSKDRRLANAPRHQGIPKVLRRGDAIPNDQQDGKQDDVTQPEQVAFERLRGEKPVRLIPQ